jgi:hypothetical protein
VRLSEEIFTLERSIPMSRGPFTEGIFALFFEWLLCCFGLLVKGQSWVIGAICGTNPSEIISGPGTMIIIVLAAKSNIAFSSFFPLWLITTRRCWIILRFREAQYPTPGFWQCCGSVTFWVGSGFSDPYLWLTNPDADIQHCSELMNRSSVAHSTVPLVFEDGF